MLKALYEVVSKAGGNMGETSKSSILSLIEDDLDVDDGTAILPLNPCHGRFGHFPLTEVALGGLVRMDIAGARLLGVLVGHLSPEDSTRVIRYSYRSPPYNLHLLVHWFKLMGSLLIAGPER